MVKHRNEELWALPGGRIVPPEEPATRAVIAVAEATGLRMNNLQFVGEYAGRVSANQVFIAEAEGALQPNPTYIQYARWWDLEEDLQLQNHVNGILALIPERTEVDNELSEVQDEEETEIQKTDQELESGGLDLEVAAESTELLYRS